MDASAAAAAAPEASSTAVTSSLTDGSISAMGSWSGAVGSTAMPAPPSSTTDVAIHAMPARPLPRQKHPPRPCAGFGSSTSLATLDSVGGTSTGAEADELTCVICMEEPTDAVLVHGGSAHVCCCQGCARNLQALDASCPMCRKPIEAVLRLYFA